MTLKNFFYKNIPDVSTQFKNYNFIKLILEFKNFFYKIIQGDYTQIKSNIK